MGAYDHGPDPDGQSLCATFAFEGLVNGERDTGVFMITECRDPSELEAAFGTAVDAFVVLGREHALERERLLQMEAEAELDLGPPEMGAGRG
jgi:hypothetical protein